MQSTVPRRRSPAPAEVITQLLRERPRKSQVRARLSGCETTITSMLDAKIQRYAPSTSIRSVWPSDLALIVSLTLDVLDELAQSPVEAVAS